MGTSIVFGLCLLVGCGETITEIVQEAPAAITISPPELSIDALGAVAGFTADMEWDIEVPSPLPQVFWANLDPDIVTVDGSGSVRSIENGTARIVAVVNGRADTATVVVSQMAASVLVEPGTLNLTQGQSASLDHQVVDRLGVPIDSPPAIAWSTADSTIAVVSPAGRVTGLRPGLVSVSATAATASGSAEVIVESTPGACGGASPGTGELNEPDGMTAFVNENGSRRNFGSCWVSQPKWTNDTYTAIVVDSANPTGSNLAIEKRWYIGDPTDNSNGLTTLHHFSSVGGFPARELYLRYRLKFSPNYDPDPNFGGVKFGYWGSAGNTGAPTQYFMSNAAAGPPPFHVYFSDNTGSPPNVQEFSEEGFLTLDEWHTIEAHIVAQSGVDVADGSITIWVNGVEAINITGANFVTASDGFDLPYFDGVQVYFIRGNAGRSFVANDWIRIGELYISGKL